MPWMTWCTHLAHIHTAHMHASTLAHAHIHSHTQLLKSPGRPLGERTKEDPAPAVFEVEAHGWKDLVDRSSDAPAAPVLDISGELREGQLNFLFSQARFVLADFGGMEWTNARKVFRTTGWMYLLLARMIYDQRVRERTSHEEATEIEYTFDYKKTPCTGTFILPATRSVLLAYKNPDSAARAVNAVHSVLAVIALENELNPRGKDFELVHVHQFTVNTHSSDPLLQNGQAAVFFIMLETGKDASPGALQTISDDEKEDFPALQNALHGGVVSYTSHGAAVKSEAPPSYSTLCAWFSRQLALRMLTGKGRDTCADSEDILVDMSGATSQYHDGRFGKDDDTYFPWTTYALHELGQNVRVVTVHLSDSESRLPPQIMAACSVVYDLICPNAKQGPADWIR